MIYKKERKKRVRDEKKKKKGKQSFFSLTDFHIHVIIDEQISKFEITVDDPVVVQVLATQNSMAHEVSGLGLRHCLPPLVQFKKRLEAKKEIKQQNLEHTGTSNI